MTERAEGQGQPREYLPTDGLTVEQDIRLAELLGLWGGGQISTPVFTELARMIPQPIVETVVFRIEGRKLETLLIPRPDDDIVWPGMYHNPGAALRRADYFREDNIPLNGVFERVQKREIGADFKNYPSYVGRVHRLADRGPEVAEIYFAEMPEGWELAQGQVWFSVDDLPDNPKFIQGQLGHIRMAAQKFLEAKLI